MHTEKTHLVFKIIGIIALLVGILGIFLPLVPAFVFIPLGLSLLCEKRVHDQFK